MGNSRAELDAIQGSSAENAPHKVTQAIPSTHGDDKL
mgnify:CR=1 FL=1|jgi:hypothetical protein